MLKITPLEVIRAAIVALTPPPAEPPPTPTPSPITTSQPASPTRPPATGRPSVFSRIGKWLQKADRAVQGLDGSKQTFKVARILWNDFGLDEADGWPLFVEWNERCDPKWPLERDEGGKQCLRRKWAEAAKKGACPKGRGWKLREWEEKDRAKQAARKSSDRDIAAHQRNQENNPDPTAGDLPEIFHNKCQYRHVEQQAMDALIDANDPPFVFVGNGGVLVDLPLAEPGQPPRARALEAASLRPIFARVANWMETVKNRSGETEVQDSFPPAALLNSFPERGGWPGVPHLRCVVTYPVFTPTWELIADDGYHTGSGIYCHLNGLDLPAVPDQPTADELAEARHLILTELLGDFPFVNDASRAHAVAMMILPLIRHTINGPTPLAVADAPTEGTGKSLMVEAGMLATLGEIPEAITADMKEEERDKTLLALVVEGQPIIFFDNANKTLDSASFALMLTARHKRGRILGETRTARAEVNVCWMLTGNNFTCSREIARRLYWSRIDAAVETPSQRTGWRHPDLLEWVRGNRPRLLWAMVVMVNHWRAVGSPPGTQVLGKFEQWSKTVGGILGAAGIPGFLGNVDEFRKHCADTAGEWAEFVKRWWAKSNTSPVITGDLFEIAAESLEGVLTAESEEGKRKQLGRAIKKNTDRVIGKWQIKVAVDQNGEPDRDYAGRPRYRLIEAGKRGDKDKEAPSSQYVKRG